ncbi:hypothetical protein [Oceanospirillum maris]|uniref:hypothetical protein n=1 Tax=Oceanospirillum maris TaxID=64977 RepID=UPI000400B880|nr:hypothetical protein [Oceanospirillum maris]
MTQYPIFIDFECSSPDEDGFPVAVCWSTPDGQVKSTLITPEDSWLESQSHLFDDSRIDINDLMLHGVSPLAVIRELQGDIDTDVVYVDGSGEDEHWLDMLLDSYQMNAQVAVEPAPSLYDVSYDEWVQIRDEWLAERGMDPYQSEANVLAMLHLHQVLTDGSNE